MRWIRVARAATAGGVVIVAVVTAGPVAASAASAPVPSAATTVSPPVRVAPATVTGHQLLVLRAVAANRPTNRLALLLTVAAGTLLSLVAVRITRRSVPARAVSSTVAARPARGPPGTG